MSTSTATQVAKLSPQALIGSFTFGDKTFKCSAYVAAHLLWTAEKLQQQHRGCRIHVIQPCYHTGVAASAGTHNRDAVLDVEIEGMDWWPAQQFLRSCGWGAWYRHTGDWARSSAWHIHMFDLGYVRERLPVGTFIPGQRTDYYNHAMGLTGQHASGSDTSWFPKNIDATIFDFAAWQEDYMPLSDDDVNRIAEAVWTRIFTKWGKHSAGSLLTQIAAAVGVKK